MSSASNMPGTSPYDGMPFSRKKRASVPPTQIVGTARLDGRVARAGPLTAPEDEVREAGLLDGLEERVLDRGHHRRRVRPLDVEVDGRVVDDLLDVRDEGPRV